MTSQEENPAPVSQSQSPPMNSEKTKTEAHRHSKPFSIREYVFSRRQKNMLNSWPFSERSLQMCLKEGVSINDVLPPFHEPLNAASSNLLHLRHDNNINNKDHVNVCKADQAPHLNEHPQNVINEYDLLSNDPSYEEGNQPSAEDAFTLPISSTDDVDDESNPTLVLLKEIIGKRKRGRERSKISSMVDILADARHCTLDEDDLRLNQNTEPIKSKPVRVTRQPTWLKGFVPK